MQAWEADIDRVLVARLARPLVQPGVIRMALVRRILAGVAALTERLPLLARFGRHRELVATTRIVHARWTRPAPGQVATVPPVARPIVHAVPSRAVERPSPLFVTREPPATAILVAAQEPRPAAPPSSHDLVRIADPAVRRSRVGAPLPARPQLAARTQGHGPPPAPLLVAPTARATAGTRAATASPLLRVRPRATGPIRPAMIADAADPANLPVVAVTRAAPPPVPATRPIVAPLAGPAMPLAGHRLVPSVLARSGNGDPAHAGALPLAHPLPIGHPPPAAPAAIAALPAASAPGPIAAPRPTAQAAVPSAPPPQKIDLHRLAEQVQHILVRQAAHTRARQGLPR